MDAREFYKEFVLNTNEDLVWDGEIGKGRTYKEIYKTDEPAYTELVNKVIIHNIVKEAGYEPQHEYFRVDTIGWVDAGYRKMEDARKLGLNRHLWNLMVAVEHENSKADWLDEVIKLEHLRCPLKVVIGYNYCDMRDGEEIEKLQVASRWMKEIAAYDENSKEEYLVILGNGEAKKNKSMKYERFDYRGYLYDFKAGEFQRIYCDG
ncbi:MAG: hypothetical protein NC548_35240 [Lachnospiraceae bacterium]|nr:hypothetical protein [Lachnospiraceae bacterium]